MQRRPLASITAVWLQRQSRKVCGAWMSLSGGPAVAKQEWRLMFRHRSAILSSSEPLGVASCRREAHTDEELWACSRLRAQCFYAYPPEREFAGKVDFSFALGPFCVLLDLLSFCVQGCAELEFGVQLHQVTMAREEFEALRGVRDTRATGGAPSHAVCLMAVTASSDVPDASPLLQIDSATSSSGSVGAPSSSGETVVGSLDLCNVRAVAGEVLIGAYCKQQSSA